jgi:hypothetical protein
MAYASHHCVQFEGLSSIEIGEHFVATGGAGSETEIIFLKNPVTTAGIELLAYFR